MIYGLDYLGGAKYQDVILREHPAWWAAGFFAKQFGDAFPVAEALARTGRCPLIRFQLLWGGSSHVYGDKDIPEIKKLSAKCEALKKKFPNIEIEISCFCEHNLPNPDKYHDIVKAYAPSCTPVNTPWRGAKSKKYKNEIHGAAATKPIPGKYNYSFDGDSCVDANADALRSAHLGCDVFFYWNAQLNLKLNDGDKTPGPQRKAVPTGGLIDSIIYLHNSKGNTKLPADFIWKSHADQHLAPKPEPRAHKPVLIAPVKAPRFELVAANGQVIAVGKYEAIYRETGAKKTRYIYRFDSDYGFNMAEKARRIQGDPVCTLRANGKNYGRVNPAFRENAYR